MAKTTKKARGIQSLIKFQRHQGIESLTIEGKEALADLTQDKHGDTSLILNADEDKINEIESTVPYLQAESVLSGGNPDKLRTAIISQDLTQFPLSGGELVTVTKTTEGLTLDDSKVKELVETKATELKKELGSGAGSGTGATANPITLNGGELVKVDKSGDTLTLNDGKVKELVDTKTNQVKTELIGMLPQKVIIDKVDDINNAILHLPIRPDDTVAYITIICINTDNTESVVTLSVPTGTFMFKNVEHGIYTFYDISRENVTLNMYFKKTVSNLIVKMIVFGDIYEEPTIDLNTLEGTYDSHITTGNTAQPLDGDRL
jgi:hypothetical protein